MKKFFFSRFDKFYESGSRIITLFERQLLDAWQGFSMTSGAKNFLWGVSSTVFVAGVVYRKQSLEGKATERNLLTHNNKTRQDILVQSLRYINSEMLFRVNKIEMAENSIESLVDLKSKFEAEHAQHWISREYAETKLFDYEYRIRELQAEIQHARMELAYLRELSDDIETVLTGLIDVNTQSGDLLAEARDYKGLASKH